jgi:hypothetical protein
VGDLMAFIEANVLKDAQQHGVKGQKWGVRKDAVGVGSVSTDKHDGIATTGPKPSTTDVAHLTTAVKEARKGALSTISLGRIESLNTKIENDLAVGKYKWDDHRQATYDRSVSLLMAGAARQSLSDKRLSVDVVSLGNQKYSVVVGHKNAVRAFTKSIGHALTENFGVVTSEIDVTRNSLGLVVSMTEGSGEPLAHHGIKGQKWGVRRAINPATGLVARTSSADQIHQDRVAKKLSTHGSKALSNKDIQDYVRRLQLQKELDKATKEAIPEKTHGFIRNYIHNQGARQIDRVANKAIDVAVEKAVEQFGLSLGKKGHNPDVVASIVETSKRLKPKKK